MRRGRLPTLAVEVIVGLWRRWLSRLIAKTVGVEWRCIPRLTAEWEDDTILRLRRLVFDRCGSAAARMSHAFDPSFIA